VRDVSYPNVDQINYELWAMCDSFDFCYFRSKNLLENYSLGMNENLSVCGMSQMQKGQRCFAGTSYVFYSKMRVTVYHRIIQVRYIYILYRG
jgi:hypothetical protein